MTSWREDLTNNMQDCNHHHCITFQDVLDAAQNIQGIAYKTPVMTCSSIGSLITSNNNNNDDNDNNNPNHLDLFFKVEALQRTGSFKFRGALNAIQSLIIAAASNDHEEEGIMIPSGHDNKNKKQGNTTSNSTATTTTATATATTSSSNHNSNSNSTTTNTTNNHTSTTLHVVTHSSGNHAAAVALAAKLSSQSCLSKQHSRPHSAYKNHIQSTIVMPKNAPTIKVEGVKGFGGNIVMVESTNEAREEKANEIVSQTGAYFIHPSENPRVIAGQGTVCLEFVQQVREWTGGDDLDVVIIPVGGGGLAAGNAIALRGLLGDRVKIVLAEPKEMDDAKRSKEAGILLKHEPGNQLNSVADGLKTTLGPNTWPIIRDLVDDIITVTEYEILRATKLIWERLKVCIEPSAGVGVAVALGEEFQGKFCKRGQGESRSLPKKVGIVLCGGNVDVIKIARLMESCGL